MVVSFVDTCTIELVVAQNTVITEEALNRDHSKACA